MSKDFSQTHLAYSTGTTNQQSVGQSATLNTTVKAIPECFLPSQWEH
jgi:hypothetical protein